MWLEDGLGAMPNPSVSLSELIIASALLFV